MKRRSVARRWLDAHTGERTFCWVHLYEPHAPYAPPEPFASRFHDDPYAGDFEFKVDNLQDVGVAGGGVTFTYDFDFPHVMLACEPDGSFRMTWAEIKPYLRADGALARFAK